MKPCNNNKNEVRKRNKATETKLAQKRYFIFFFPADFEFMTNVIFLTL